ncbi:hypothetical protein KKG45_00985 [bacterium]|nr:hypothetical protein [bacterium]MBU1071800.1 hypothetical protein [bacterium]MBU1674669.1 hypothetical protein [bacterium]
MPRRTTMILLLATVMLAGCAGTSGDLRGSWILVQRQGRDLEVGDRPTPNDIVKILNDDRFAFAAQQGPGEIFGGGGTWRREGDTYVETIRYHSHPELVGAVATFRCRVEDDFWYHAGEFDANGRRYVIDEVWRRLDEEGDR